MANAAKRLFICLDNGGYEVSLERLKIYVALPEAKANGAFGGPRSSPFYSQPIKPGAVSVIPTTDLSF